MGYRGVWSIAIRGLPARSVVSRLVRFRAIKKGQNLDYAGPCSIMYTVVKFSELSHIEFNR